MHWFTEKGEKIQREITKPPAITYYNMYMGAVDLFDQFRSYISLEFRSNKYWHALMWFIFESALVNSWVLYKATCEAANVPLRYTHHSFRRAIALGLAKEWETMGCREKGLGASPASKMKSPDTRVKFHLRKKGKLDLEKPANSIEMHFEKMDKIPPKPGSTKKHRQFHCLQCKNKLTTFWCTICEAPLCRGPCFANYHSNQST
jgi:hypothetical protein